MEPARPKTDWTDAELDDLTLRSQHGDAAALRELLQAMRVYPYLERQFGDLSGIARQRIAESAVGSDNLLLLHMLDREVIALRGELEATTRSPLERLLIERVLTSWMALYLTETTANSLRGARAEFYEKRLDRAHTRYLASVLALARVSRLLAPSIAQINIAAAGAQQLNLAAPAPSGALEAPTQSSLASAAASSPLASEEERGSGGEAHPIV